MLGTLFDLARQHGGEVIGDDRRVDRIAPLSEAGEQDLAPFTHARYRTALEVTRAGAVLTTPRLSPRVAAARTTWIHPDPTLVLARVLGRLAPATARGIHPRAIVDATATVHPTAGIEAGAVVGADVVIGPDTLVGPNAVIGPGTRLGARVRIGPGAVVGSDGFGFARSEQGLLRIPHQGRVEVEDDVEIGANSTIARATLGVTLVRRGTKIDNLVHIGHNVELGPHTVLAAQVGVAGSSTIGASVQIGGQAGIADHVCVADGARLSAKAGVIGDVPPGATYAGYPAVERQRWLREQATLARMTRGGRSIGTATSEPAKRRRREH